jgi:hypothetical protein
MQAATRHDIGLSAENSGGEFFHVHQFKQAELTLFMVEKKIDVGIVCRFPARRRSEQIQAFDAEPLEFGFVRTQSAYGVIPSHLVNITKPGVHCPIFGRLGRLRSASRRGAYPLRRLNLRPYLRSEELLRSRHYGPGRAPDDTTIDQRCDRTSISIEKDTLDRFYRAYPAGKRSQVIQRLIELDLEAKNDHLGRMARIVETDPAFQTVRDDSALWEAATQTDGLIDE